MRFVRDRCSSVSIITCGADRPALSESCDTPGLNTQLGDAYFSGAFCTQETWNDTPSIIQIWIPSHTGRCGGITLLRQGWRQAIKSNVTTCQTVRRYPDKHMPPRKDLPPRLTPRPRAAVVCSFPSASRQRGKGGQLLTPLNRLKSIILPSRCMKLPSGNKVSDKVTGRMWEEWPKQQG